MLRGERSMGSRSLAGCLHIDLSAQRRRTTGARASIRCIEVERIAPRRVVRRSAHGASVIASPWERLVCLALGGSRNQPCAHR